MNDDGWTTERVGAWELADLVGQGAASGRPYLEFLRVPDLSVGLYVLDAGGVDHQSPHTEDEAYVVMRGRARFRMGDQDVPIGQGTTLFVAAGVEHRFHDIAEQLVLLVAFGPAEGSRS